MLKNNVNTDNDTPDSDNSLISVTAGQLMVMRLRLDNRKSAGGAGNENIYMSNSARSINKKDLVLVSLYN